MKYLSVLKQSFRSIMSNKVRSFLTVLGIIIGIGSVIGLMSLGAGVKESINKQINSLGTTNLTITSGAGISSRISNFSTTGGSQQSSSNTNVTSTKTLTRADVAQLETISKDIVSHVAGYVSSPATITVGSVSQSSVALGVSSDYFAIYSLSLSEGQYPSTTNNEAEVVLGSDLAKNIFGDTDPIGQKVIIQNVEFTVTGVISAQKESSFSNPNLQAYITDTEGFKIFEISNYSTIIVQAASENTVDSAKSEVESTLLRSHNITDKSKEDFSITSSKDLLSTVDSIMSMLTYFLAGIAGISLLVGGIGIMNIMLVSVTERTREIGLRKALGAKTSNILIQFLTEALVLTLLGGILGVLFGYGLGSLASLLLKFNAIVTLNSILLAVGVSSFIGVVFGIYPAARAARLNPIDALRYE